MSKISSIVKDASTTLQQRNGDLQHIFSIYHCGKAIPQLSGCIIIHISGDHNHPVAVPGHAAGETNACRVLGESPIRWDGIPSCLSQTPDLLHVLQHILIEERNPYYSYPLPVSSLKLTNLS